MSDDFDLDRFVQAQEPVYARVTAELGAGRKATHWMWFIFPQIRGLGHSAMAQRYAIGSLAEANAYLAHPVLGRRIEECTRLVLKVEGRSAHQIFGDPDTLKFQSSMTLFDALGVNEIFGEALDKYFEGHRDAATLERLQPA